MIQTDIHILILAAGASSRMAPRDKLLEAVDGVPLLARITRCALETGAMVTVVLPPDKPLRLASIRKLPVQIVIAEAAKDGLSASLRAGLLKLPEDADVMMLLADLPEITTADLVTMLAAYRDYPGRILRATSSNGTPGHPVIFPANMRGELMTLTGDHGAGALLKTRAEQVVPVALPAQHAVTDLDTAEEWESWRKLRQIK